MNKPNNINNIPMIIKGVVLLNDNTIANTKPNKANKVPHTISVSTETSFKK